MLQATTLCVTSIRMPNDYKLNPRERIIRELIHVIRYLFIYLIIYQFFGQSGYGFTVFEKYSLVRLDTNPQKTGQPSRPPPAG